MAFVHTVTVRFHETDRAGIVFFGRFFEYCHIVYEEMLIQALGGMETMFENGWSMPLVHAEADYKKPLRLGDRIPVHLTVERLGKGSITFSYSLKGYDGEERASAKLVHAFVDMETFEGRSAPPELIEALQRLGVLTLEGRQE